MTSNPSSIFHLKLELYPYPTPTRNKRQKIVHSTLRETFVPSPGTDIFHTVLPSHKRTEWEQSEAVKWTDTTSTPKNNTTAGQSLSAASTPHSRSGEHHRATRGDALLLPERTLKRNDTPPKSPVRRCTKPSNETAALDWRYDAVSIDSIDMEPRTDRAGQAKASHSGLHTKAMYIPSSPATTDVGWGIVHLYRDTEESSQASYGGPTRKSLLEEVDSSKNGRGAFSIESCSTLCILAVPSWMMPSDLLGFVGDQAREDVSHFRLIRTGRANKYMVLMKFRSAKKARDWQAAYNGRLFSSAEPENCHVVFIKSVEFVTPGSTPTETSDAAAAAAAASFPRNNRHDPFTASAEYVNGTSKTLTSKPLAPPPPNLLELPTCPVCLERMDETSGLLTILCQHVFHCACLEKWRFQGSGCPVCRYTQNPSYTFPYPRPSDGDQAEAAPACSVCAADFNLWICLICGNVGCGRYDSAHAYAHYEATSHCYAMDIDSQRVWDYAGDGYVHRLIQSKPFAENVSKSSTGTFADAPGSGEWKTRHENEAFRAEGSDMVPREKMESMANEYTYLLTSQLEGQRRYFEEQVERAADKASQASVRADDAIARAEHARRLSVQHQDSNHALNETVAKLQKQLERSEKARAKFEQVAREMSRSLREEKTMNEGLLERVHAAEKAAEAMRSEMKTAREEIADLQETNRDLTMFISSQEKVRELQAQGEEVVDGSVSLPQGQSAKSGKKGKGKKK